MPIECRLLENAPSPLARCPKCGVEPFVPFLRGTVQRRRRRWFFFGEKWDYCALICEKCKEIVGYESPDWKDLTWPPPKNPPPPPKQPSKK